MGDQLADEYLAREGSVNRRRFLTDLLIGGGVALAAACQAAPAPPPMTAPAPAPTTAPAVTAQAGSDWQTQYGMWQSGAKSEGSIVVLGPPTPQLKTTLPQAFKAAFGIDMQYSGEATATAGPRLASERAGGVYSTDIVIAGAGSMYQTIASSGQMTGDVMGMLAPLKPKLIVPEVLDATRWRDNRLWFPDPQGAYVYRMTSFSQHAISVNTSVVKTSDITSWNDLQKPEYKGKITSFDPSINGSAVNTLGYLWQKLGADFVRNLYQGQQVFVVRNAEQEANGLGKADYPIALFLEPQALGDLIKQGLPVDEVPPPPDALPTTSAGFGMLGVLDHAPHPNAANLFANWILSKAGQQVFQDAQLQPSRRNDLDQSSYPAWFAGTIPTEGQQYFDVHDWKFVLETLPPIQKQFQAMVKSA
jgi:iron(III) transport system substrate-binding protein